MTNTKPFVLLILDGFGYREEEKYNAIANANTPTWKKIWSEYPHTLIQGSGHYVGLPDNQMGNSEVGHLNIGAGRVVYQELTRIDKSIEDGEFFKNPVFCNALDDAKTHNKTVHIMGLLSPGGVHSHENHIEAIIKLALEKNISKIYFHAFLDGRDTPPKSALPSLEKIEAISGVQIATIMGRYYAMDRDKRWERTEAAFELLTQSKADYSASTPQEALEKAYQRCETDEFVKPTIIHPVAIKPEDLIIFMNFRTDRARQLTRMFLEKGYAHFVTLTQYADDLSTQIAFPLQSLSNTLGEYLSNLHLKQFRIAETEKYAHITFFFNGGIEKPFPNEERLLIPSPKIATYDLQPEMSAPELTKELVKAIHSKQFDFIVCNYANPDMVGHTGNYEATLKAIETIDHSLAQIMAALKETNGEMIITADHGNAECMYDEKTHQPHTAHTSDPVPFVYIGRAAKIVNNKGNLSDIAPTILYLMGIDTPKEMTGKNLLELLSL
jgi:2,3-bisphosphoglycerate-independent phosphoglycerate mutase